MLRNLKPNRMKKKFRIWQKLEYKDGMVLTKDLKNKIGSELGPSSIGKW